MSFDEILTIPPYSLSSLQKKERFMPYFSELTRYHYNNCGSYRKILDSMGFDPGKQHSMEDYPFLPVQLFKSAELLSVPHSSVIRRLQSSGTSGQQKSLILLDKENASNQMKVLSKIVSSFIGPKRLPLILVDSENILASHDHLSASATGVLGFSLFGSKTMFALDENMQLKTDQLWEFISRYKDERILLYGFTYKVYLHFCRELRKMGVKLDLQNAILIHGGGWKKMQSEAVSAECFNDELLDSCGITDVYDYYGMVEQTGSIFMQCKKGNYHVSVFSELIIRRPTDFSIAGTGEEGLIQVLSLLPSSYPGHSLLTSDKGVLLGEDDCACGRHGKYFRMTERLKMAEIRGCSDTYERALS
jgi:phenylacetate-coenzyme A ligase PaaK-like adenylate-forming protein